MKKLLNGMVLIEPMEEQEVSKNGVIIVKVKQDKYKLEKGTVIQTNEGIRGSDVPSQVVRGDVVVYQAMHGMDAMVDGESYKFVNEAHILCSL